MQLGAGTSLPGLAAEKLGAYVTFSYDSTKLKLLHYYHPIIIDLLLSFILL